MQMAMDKDWLFGTVVSHILTSSMTTGPVSAASMGAVLSGSK